MFGDMEFNGDLPFILMPPKLSSKIDEGDWPFHWEADSFS
jgi:hypothetical protein